LRLLAFLILLLAPGLAQYDLLVYGATPQGVAAAVAGAQEGLKVLLLEGGGQAGLPGGGAPGGGGVDPLPASAIMAPRVLSVLLLPEFSELEAALALEWARRLELPAYTVAKGRKGTPALAGSVWTPTYAFPAAPPPKALLIPGARRPERPAKDPTWLAYLEEVWEGLEALFLGFNAHLFLAEAGRLPPRVAAGEEVAERLREMGYRVEARPFLREGRVYATKGGLALLSALSDWVGKAVEL